MVGWFIVPYVRRVSIAGYVRYCQMDDYTSQILSVLGQWSESEVLGSHAIVKVRATAVALNQIDLQPGFIRIPVERLDDPLSTLSTAKKTQIRDKLEELGYSTAEIQADLGADIGSKTLRQLLIFITKRRVRPRYDQTLNDIVFDGPVESCKSVDQLNSEVSA